VSAQLYDAQQYMMTDAGYKPLTGWVAKHCEKLHSPPLRVEHLVTCGNTNGVDIALRTLLARGDVCLSEEFTYAATLQARPRPFALPLVAHAGRPQAMRPMGVNILSIPSDSEGPCPVALRGLLAARAAAGEPSPKLLYCVPVSANPTGVSWSLPRKAAVYALACEFDFLLLEDDAYFYLQFDVRAPEAAQRGLARLGPSLLSMDTQGRVIRCDTLSKFIAPGLRLGWLTAPLAVHLRLTRYMQSSVQGACSLSQVLNARMLGGWGEAGLERHLKKLQVHYARRCSALCAAARRHLGEAGEHAGGSGLAPAAAESVAAVESAGGPVEPPLATWSPPCSGMFLWLRLGCGVADSAELQPMLKEYKVAVVPGRVFSVSGAPTPYVRLSFASATDAEFDAGMARLAGLLRARVAPA